MIWSSCFEPVPPILMVLGARGLHGVDVFLRGLVRRIGIDPEHELVERQHRDRRQVVPVERHAGRKRRGEQVRQRDDDLVRVALASLTSRKPSAPAPPDLLTTIIGCFISLCLVTMPWIDARHLVGAAAGAGGNDEFDGPHRLPCGGCRSSNAARAQSRKSRRTPYEQNISFDSLPSNCHCAGLCRLCHTDVRVSRTQDRYTAMIISCE